MAAVAKRRRSYNLRLVKATWPYSVQEIAELFGVHKNLPLRWMHEGLIADTSVRPFLIRGDELIRFLRERQGRRKRKCALREFYCFKCRTPKEAYLGIADIEIESPTRFRVKTICPICSTSMSKVQAMRNLEKIQASFEIQKLEDRRIKASAKPSVNSDSEGAR